MLLIGIVVCKLGDVSAVLQAVRKAVVNNFGVDNNDLDTIYGGVTCSNITVKKNDKPLTLGVVNVGLSVASSKGAVDNYTISSSLELLTKRLKVSPVYYHFVGIIPTPHNLDCVSTKSVYSHIIESPLSLELANGCVGKNRTSKKHLQEIDGFLDAMADIFPYADAKEPKKKKVEDYEIVSADALVPEGYSIFYSEITHAAHMIPNIDLDSIDYTDQVELVDAPDSADEE